uniref:Large ribosomal subunit protein uL13c n=1 Tax=Chondria sp. (in: red algae) TaxID=1982705 RepID=A0A1Z1MEC8_9FLOR|nr:ribosomal protein L13 [Chondria sp. (in: red algae)]
MFTNHNLTLIPQIQKNTTWYLVDAKRQKLGRMCSKIAYMLRGKNDRDCIPFKQNNIKIIVINSKEVEVTGKKKKQKLYRRHSGRPGGLKTEVFNHLQNRIPNKIIEKAVKGMLPKNILGRQLFKQLKIYSGQQHPHEAQKPIILNINSNITI